MTSELILFGGSFNPVHNGHVAIVQYVHAQHPTAPIAVVPCAEHPFGKPLAPFADRVAMCRLAFAPFAYVTVSEMERARIGASYTADTVRALQAHRPARRISFIIGADAVADFSHWHDAAWLQANVPLIVIPRGPHGPVPEVSSSDVRASLAKHESVAALVPPVVAEYLRNHPQLFSCL